MTQRIVLSIVLAALTLGAWLPFTSLTTAQVLPPRPTITPIPPDNDNPERPRERRTAVPDSRITGTVIDLTTGAPAPGIAVQVGDITVTSDSNGNYDRSALPAGSYAVALKLTPEQGVAAQDVIMIDLPAATTVVQHLAFRSPLPPTPVPPTPEPAIAEAPVALPPTATTPQPGIPLMLLGICLLAAGLGLRAARNRR